MSLPRSLRGRLLVLVLSLVVAVWAGMGLATWLDMRHELDELLDSHLAQAAALLVAQQARNVGEGAEGDVGGDRGDEGHGDEHGHRIDAPSLHRYAPKVSFQVWHEGRLALRSANAPAQPMSELGQGFETRRIGDTAWRVFAAQGAEHDVQVYVGEQLASRSDILWAALRSTLWPVALALPLLALAVWWAVHQGLKPMQRLGQTLAQRQPQAIEPVQIDATPAEMMPLLAALNDLLARIGTLLESERRFTADASHELRTPIAAIRAQAQVALGAGDDASRRHALAATLQGCDRASRLVDQMLTLSRLEAQPLAAQAAALGPVDVSALAQRVVADLAGQALARQQGIELNAPQPCSVPGDETLLGVLVRNLVDNALRYSPPHAQVRVSVHRDNGQVCLSVEDSGPGLPEADLARLGERFFRPLGQAAPGSGLGWSIVQRVAQAHGAQVVASRSSRLGGLQVQVRWPLG